MKLKDTEQYLPYNTKADQQWFYRFLMVLGVQIEWKCGAKSLNSGGGGGGIEEERPDEERKKRRFNFSLSPLTPSPRCLSCSPVSLRHPQYE